MKKSIFIKDGKYFYQEYTDKFPYHCVYCEVLNLSGNNFFKNNISNMDVYLDIEEQIYNFFKVFREEDSKKEIIDILNNHNINELRDFVQSGEYDNKNILKALKLYIKLYGELDEVNNADYLMYYSKRTEKYIDELLVEEFNELKYHKKYLIPIIDRLREIQFHKFKNDFLDDCNIKNFIELFDVEDTLFGVDLADKDIDIKLYENIINFLCDIKSNIKGLIHLVCNDNDIDIILSKLKNHSYSNEIVEYDIEEKVKTTFMNGDYVQFFEFDKINYNYVKTTGIVYKVEGNEITIKTDKYTNVTIDSKYIRKYLMKEQGDNIDSPINWYGGKYYMAKDIINIFQLNKIDRYVEVFGGAAHILFKKPFLEKYNIYNDKNEGLYSFFKTISDEKNAKYLLRSLILTPYHQLEWETCNKWNNEKDIIEKARKFYTRTMQSRSNSGGWAFARDKKYARRSMSASVSKWLGNIEKNILIASDKIKSVEIENSDFEDIIKKYDSKDTLFYLDPPYLLSTRTFKKAYKYELDINDHERLVNILLNIKGKVVLSGYDNDIYKRLETEGNYRKILIKEAVKPSVNKNREDKTGKEYIWVNYEIEDSNKEILYICNDILVGFSEKNKSLYNKYLKNNKYNLPKISNCNSNKKSIKNLENSLKINLPKEYVSFLIKFNGGILKSEKNINGLNIICFLGIGELLKEFDIEANAKIYEDILPKGFLPIAILDEDKIVCMNLFNGYNDIYIFDVNNKDVEKIANDFNEFVKLIK